MIITCNECDSSFNVDDSLLKDTGSKVRCSKCSSVFVVFPEASGSELENGAEDLALEMDDDLNEQQDADVGAGDELPDLEEMMEFEDDDLGLDVSAEEDSDTLGLDLEMEADDTDMVDESLAGDEELGLDFEGDEESLIEEQEAELGHLETGETDLPETDMDLEADEALTAAAGDGGDELDLSDLEDLVASDTELDTADETSEVAADADLEMEEVSPEVAADADLDMEEVSPDVTADADLEMEDVTPDATADADLDLDLDLEPDEIEPAAAEAAGAEDASKELDLSELEDLVASGEDMQLEDVATEAADDHDLDLEPDAEPAVAGLEAGALESDELDLSDLDDIIDSAEEPAAESQDAEAGADLVAEPAGEAPLTASAETGDDADELDFSDLEGIMDSEEPPKAEAADDLELEFEVDEGAGEAAPAEPAQAAEADELDISELDKILEAEEKPASAEPAELELDLDVEPEKEAAAVSAESDDAEFLDIEKMLEDNEAQPAAAQDAEEVVELDLEAVMDEAAQSKEPELELNLDLDAELQEADTPLESAASGEDDLEFDLLESDEETMQFGATQAAATQLQEDLSGSEDMGATSEDFATEEFGETKEIYGQTDAIDTMAADIGEPVKSRGIRKPLMTVVFLLLLGVLGIIVTNTLGIRIPYVSDVHIPYISDIKIPYLSGLITPKVEDTAGNLKITPMSRTISYKFINNNRAGKILVVSGQVRNEYDHPRSNIKVTGKLYQKDKSLAKTATVYCGNMLSDADLRRMDIQAINKRLQNRFGDNRSNIKVKTSKTIPFIIVFNKLPANLDEYSVEVAGSSS